MHTPKRQAPTVITPTQPPHNTPVRIPVPMFASPVNAPPAPLTTSPFPQTPVKTPRSAKWTPTPSPPAGIRKRGRSKRYLHITEDRCREMQDRYEYNMLLASLEAVRRSSFKTARNNITLIYIPKNRKLVKVGKSKKTKTGLKAAMRTLSLT